MSGRIDVITALVLIVTIAVGYRLVLFNAPASLIGMDPDAYAVQIARLLDGQPLRTIDFSFYDKAPIHLFVAVILARLTGLSAVSASVVFPVLIGTAFPLFAGLLARELGPSKYANFAAITAATIAAVEAFAIQFAVAPIGQTTAAVFWCTSILFLIYYFRRNDWYFFIGFVVSVVALVFTHKLPVILLAASLAVAWIGRRLFSRFYSLKTGSKSDLTWIGIGIGLAVIQILFLTDFAVNLFFKIITLLATDLGVGADETIVRTAAVPATAGFERLLARFAPASLLLTVAGVAWIYLIYINFSNGATVGVPTLLSFVAVVTSVLFLSVGAPSVAQPVRVFFILGPLIAVLIGVTAATARTSIRLPQKVAHYGSIVIVLTIILTQSVAAPASPEYPNDFREYLTEEEVEAKEWVHKNIEGPVYADYYYSLEVVPSQVEARAQKQEPTLAFEDAARQHQIKPLSSELTNASIRDKNIKYIIYRDIGVYRTSSGVWNLTWDYKSYLEREYNVVKKWGDVTLYKKSSN